MSKTYKEYLKENQEQVKQSDYQVDGFGKVKPVFPGTWLKRGKIKDKYNLM